MDIKIAFLMEILVKISSRSNQMVLLPRVKETWSASLSLFIGLSKYQGHGTYVLMRLLNLLLYSKCGRTMCL